MSAVYNELSSPIPNDYTEPLFDNGANLEPDGDGYSVPYDGMVVRKPYQQDAKSGNYQQRSQSFVQPATNLNLLLAQIKETLVMEISPDRIWYVLCIMCVFCGMLQLYEIFVIKYS